VRGVSAPKLTEAYLWSFWSPKKGNLKWQRQLTSKQIH